ncbi:hypothetical protein BGZ65_007989 [Modicella reniformis]|uniref:Uncharacterized protein n=1 Tax=Modicella reniformis TaxID=1440133 RepID=A0A9P6M261_9FUNG|nr:hypothetical protein BGZ65_007989 [Modicella reniformis]
MSETVPQTMDEINTHINRYWALQKAYIERDGIQTTTPTEASSPSSHKHVAHELNKLLLKDLSPSTTTIHMDGRPSKQKSKTREEKAAALEKTRDALSTDIYGVLQTSRGVTPAIYRKIKQLFRTPKVVVDEIVSELRELGWSVCQCPFQADTHIAQVCRDSPDPEKITSP